MKTLPQILVVEDHADAREMLVEWLEAIGFEVRSAENGQDAMLLLEHGLRPSLVLLDLMMPVMDGWTFLKIGQASGLLRGVPVWIVSAVEHDLPAGVDGYLPKPVDLQKLRRIVDGYRRAPEQRKLA